MIDFRGWARCASCHAEVPSTQRFCGRCGTPVTPASQTGTVALTGGAAARLYPANAPEEGRFPSGAVLAQRYRIGGRLGKGGMGEVYRAFDLLLGQNVALKFLPEGVAFSANSLERFRNEVRLARQVSHPNVCRVYDIGEIEGTPFLTMEYVDGEDLSSLLRRIGRLPSDKAIEISRRLCEGLAAAHEKGVLHRDLKPGNIMIDGRGEVLITDFGLAAMAGTVGSAEVRQGTPAYMAPEQLAGQEVTAKSDIYALGLVLYEIFAGRRPFEASSTAELERIRRESRPAPLASLAKDVDPAVERVILHCLAPDPHQRPSSPKVVAAALPGDAQLAAALAAGETPSPQMVANAGDSKGLRPGLAFTLFGAVLAGLAVNWALADRTALINLTPFPNSPDALATLAREHAHKLGYPDPPVDWAGGLDWNEEFLAHAREHQSEDWRRLHLSVGRPAPAEFWYRQSPRVLDPGNLAEVTQTEPGFHVSGMLRMRLDALGRLLYFAAVPRELESVNAPVPLPDWKPLFAAAGLDTPNFAPAEPQWVPLTAFDTRAAWTGVWPDAAEVPIRIEAAAWRGKPVSFRIVEPWTRSPRDAHPAPPSVAGQVFPLVISLLVLPAGCLLAWHNWKLNRGDCRGAARLALVIFCLGILNSLLSQGYVRGMAQVERWHMGAAVVFWYSALIGLLYLALEPTVRRRWPQTLIAWTRLLDGRYRDPLVGAHVLVGTVLGVGAIVVARVLFVLTRQFAATPGLDRLDTVLGARHFAGSLISNAVTALGTAVALLFLLLLLRVVLRRTWAVATVFLLLCVAGTDRTGSPVLGVIVGLVVGVTILLATQRYGLLATFVMLAVFTTIANSVQTLDPSHWYFAFSLAVLLQLVAVAAYGFRTSLGERPLLRDEFFG